MTSKLLILKKILLVIPFIILIISSITGFIFHINATSKVESIRFPSNLPDLAEDDVTITSGRLFYPVNFKQGNKYPAVIYVHGFQVTKETDLRLIFELTKRGMFALAIDIAGHGQTQEILGPYFWKGAIGAVDYIYDRPDLFNLSCVGLTGHSMGGWTSFLAMGYEAKRQNRINCSVSWAGIYNTSSFREGVLTSGNFDSDLRNIKVDTSIFYNETYLFDHNAANYYINSSLGAQPEQHPVYGPRMLIIHGSDDTTVDPQQAIQANATLGSNCTTEIYEGESHLLLSNRPITRTIQHFQLHFFGDFDNSIDLESNYTYLYIYLSYFFGLIGLFLSILSGVFLIFYKYRGSKATPRKYKPKGWLFLLLAFIPYIALIFAFSSMQILLANVIQSLLITTTLVGIYSVVLFYFTEHKRKPIDEPNYIRLNTIEHDRFSTFTGFHLGIAATFGYWLLSNLYSIFIYKPWNFTYFFYSVIYLIPIVFFNEFFWRKIIQDNIPLKNRWLRRLFMVIPTIVIGIMLIMYFNTSFLSIIAFGIVFLATSLTNIFIYSKYRSIRAVLLFSLIPVAFIAGNCYFFFM
ncbi:MAG: prolyl oligopeptidase family serine peptidase [Candidatus Lokiarchaeota archaeon]|nr:prolyl oligopeptidase family serine peptidase [Candidatus Lokiarchaeota archaeon]